MQFNKKHKRVAFLAATLTVLAGCGGGGGNSACSTQQTLNISGTGYPVAVIQAKLGVAITPITPVVAGIPDSCQGDKSFELDTPVFGLPPGIVLDGRTGTISGVPTALTSVTTSVTNNGTTSVPFPSLASVVLKLPGYGSIQLGTVRFQVTKD